MLNPKQITLTVIIFIVLLFSTFPASAGEKVTSFSRVAVQTTHDLPGMLKKRSIRVLTSFSPTIFFMDKGKIYGFEYSMLKEYEKFLNKKRPRKQEVHLEFIPVPADKLIPLLNQGYGDIAAALTTVTESRSKQVAFSNPYLPSVKEVVVANAEVSGINSLEDLSGRMVMVRKSSSFHQSLLELSQKLQQQGLDPIQIFPAPEYEPTEEILQMVNAGIIELTIADDYLAKLWNEVLPNIRVLNNIAVREGGSIAWMVRKDNPELLNSLNSFVKTVKKGTLLGNIFFKRYYRNVKFIEHPLDEKKEIENFSAYTPIFKKYAAMYGLDWRLVAALAYQESGFNHAARSRVGAVGVMQVMPMLATDKRLGIKDIHDLEKNIHLGVKYLALLRDRYYPTDKIPSESERLRFALASYNAGPTRIRNARKIATKLGLHDDIWFHNTEYGTMQLVGMEPVRYVSNINMYYRAMILSDMLIKSRQEGRKGKAEK
ncbi:transglycosylase SLT domain-containing protein [Desulfovibrio sp. JC010]|uniref:transglycosylase SLT domain-containing protein n=1 Tax=Desulfovibrio sp. JC010 TaxID=2593641 RepID=UPI0013D4C735|nr:transporter substrate-binding domain-containing protein [Desulfovibrio sp. JC010]NDV27850.1 transporter substrate-binding domain-containing protein [Desulfovibrio sp. JC010]